ncbi:MAG: Rieske (2Fe-2S) protein [Actinomycetota bacterium]|nr:Rieske (2Fe-2S) protein [Actinomycetota bacterium]
MEKVSREKFIRLAAALGVGATTASVAACGGGASGGSGGYSGNGSGDGAAVGQNTPAASAGGSEEAAAGTGGKAIAAESDVAPGGAVKFKDRGRDAVLVHLDGGEFVAYSAVCTHAGCTVAYKNAQLACPCHGSIFDPANGAEVVSGPAQTPLPEIPIRIEDGQILRA